MGLELDA